MATNESQTTPTSDGFSRLVWARTVAWFALAIAAGAAMAWAAGEETFLNPLILFPILVGVGLGAILVVLMRVLETGRRFAVILGTVLAASVTITGQHYVSYRHALQRPSKDSLTLEKVQNAFPELLRDRFPPPPESFADYMRQQAEQGRPLVGGLVAKGWQAWASWSLDAAMTLAAALAMVALAIRQPYCRWCHSWYRTVRGGRIPLPLARQMAETAEIELVADAAWARYRMSNCRSGCSPTRLELTCEDASGQILLATAWLAVPQRNRIVEILDSGEGGVGSGEVGSE